MRKLRFTCLPILIFFFPQINVSQQAISVSVFSESTSVPFTKIIDKPLHPGIQMGTDFSWQEGKNVRLYPSINIGYMIHKPLFQGLYINLELGLDIKTQIGFNAKAKLGLGYLLTFAGQNEFRLEHGVYSNEGAHGNSRIMPSLSLGVGYDTEKKKAASTEIFVMHQTWLEYPYASEFIPMMSHSNVHLGVRFFPFEIPKEITDEE